MSGARVGAVADKIRAQLRFVQGWGSLGKRPRCRAAAKTWDWLDGNRDGWIAALRWCLRRERIAERTRAGKRPARKGGRRGA